MLSGIKEKIKTHNTLINKIVTNLSIIVLVSYFLNMCYQSIKTISWFFMVDSFFKEDILNNNGGVFEIHSTILMSAIMLLYLSIFKKSIKIYMVAGILLFNTIFPTYHFVEFIAPQYLDQLGIYDWRKSDGQAMFNPQWTNVYLLIVGLSVLFVQLFMKKYRTMDKIFGFVIALSVTLTLTLFHSMIVFGYYKFQREYQVDLLSRQVQTEKRQDFCKNRMCFNIQYSNNGTRFDVTNKKTEVGSEYFDKYYPFILFVVSNYNLKENEVKSSYLQNPETVGFDYFTFAIKKIDENNAVFVLDNKNRKFSEINIVAFSLLTGVAHTIWIIMGYGILFFHKEYLFKKRKINKTEMENV